MFELDEDSAVRELGGGRFAAGLTDRWNIGPFPNGGYLAFVALRGLQAVLPHPDPLTVTTHYLKPPHAGEVTLETEVMRVGKGTSAGAVRMIQDGSEILRTTAILGDLSTLSGPKHVSAPPPEMPPPDACHRTRPEMPLPVFTQRFDARMVPGTASFLEGERNGVAELRGWTRLADGRPVDTDALVLFADAFPPPIFNVVESGWVPTLELTVHVRQRPAPGFIRCVFETRYLIGGYLEEDGRLWDERGELVALSRQLARLTPVG